MYLLYLYDIIFYIISLFPIYIISCLNSSMKIRNAGTAIIKSKKATYKSENVTAKQYHSNGTVLRTIHKTDKLISDKNENLS